MARINWFSANQASSGPKVKGTCEIAESHNIRPLIWLVCAMVTDMWYMINDFMVHTIQPSAEFSKLKTIRKTVNPYRNCFDGQPSNTPTQCVTNTHRQTDRQTDTYTHVFRLCKKVACDMPSFCSLLLFFFCKDGSDQLMRRDGTLAAVVFFFALGLQYLLVLCC